MTATSRIVRGPSPTVSDLQHIDIATAATQRQGESALD